ncbi:MAG: anaerobic glycerol-3-phosphate dehydrogenase subunit GlpB [Desulfomonilia bacterium]
MTSHVYDVVVIGGGMAGFTSALYLAEKGFKVAIISKGDPVCCLSTGCIDVLSSERNPLDGIQGLSHDHPYHLVGKKGVADALNFFKRIMEDTPMPYTGSPRKNRNILTPIGTAKTTCLVPLTMAGSDATSDTYIHVISFKGLKDFFPSYITSRLKNTGYSLYDAGTSSTIGIATLFEDASFRRDFITWIQNLEIPHGKVAFPAVLGIRTPLEILEEISTQISREIFEIPTLPPSIPGMRLFRTLKTSFLNRGGSTYWGKVIASVESQGSQVEAVTLASSGRPSRVPGRAFILSTGSFVSGGLFATRDSVQETVFDLSVFVPGRRKDWFNTDFFQAGHAIESAGIKVDRTFRPIDSQFENLFVCGSILSHAEIMKNHCGHGLAISTGLRAAQMCERHIA